MWLQVNLARSLQSVVKAGPLSSQGHKLWWIPYLLKIIRDYFSHFSHKTDKIRGNLTIQLFDEYSEDILEDDRSRTSEIYQRITSKWLGELRIPMSTIYSNPRVSSLTFFYPK